ncbi:hypothetical protein BGAL_0139g00020 [Botrytis galanthina]|uniref:Uncharacterized protein n=1 Tax=Botrytis galanthina TaxID=278940 RepID=A0A4S8QZ26_9HELO|nr:hypothetical protein BGAL_0139g00020 [Botrytis galanthina]
MQKQSPRKKFSSTIGNPFGVRSKQRLTQDLDAVSKGPARVQTRAAISEEETRNCKYDAGEGKPSSRILPLPPFPMWKLGEVAGERTMEISYGKGDDVNNNDHKKGEENPPEQEDRKGKERKGKETKIRYDTIK